MLIISTSNCHYELVDTDRILFDRDCCCSVTQSCLTLWDPHGLQHTRLTCPSSISWSLLKLMSIESVMPSTILSPVVPFSSCLQFFPTSGSFLELALCIRWPKYWSFSFSISPSNEYSELISFRINWFDLAVQGTLKSLLQHHNSKASILQCSVYYHFLNCFGLVFVSHFLLLCFLPREVPLAFVVKLIWWCWIILAFAYLECFWFLHQIWTRTLLCRIFFTVCFSLSLL